MGNDNFMRDLDRQMKANADFMRNFDRDVKAMNAFDRQIKISMAETDKMMRDLERSRRETDKMLRENPIHYKDGTVQEWIPWGPRGSLRLGPRKFPVGFDAKAYAKTSKATAYDLYHSEEVQKDRAYWRNKPKNNGLLNRFFDFRDDRYYLDRNGDLIVETKYKDAQGYSHRVKSRYDKGTKLLEWHETWHNSPGPGSKHHEVTHDHTTVEWKDYLAKREGVWEKVTVRNKGALQVFVDKLMGRG
jgi:hypothetical protein